MNRLSFLRALGVVKPDLPSSGLTERTIAIYERQAEAAHRRDPGVDLDDAPHGDLWHTSFHASKFPGKDGCARQQVYMLLNLPDKEPTPAWLIAISDAGKDIEVQLVKRWEDEGILLSASPSAPYQTNFQHKAHWLTCSVDAVLDLRPQVPWPHVVDVKGKDHHLIDDLQRGIMEPQPGHVKQIMVQMWFVRASVIVEEGWSIPEAGSLLYVSRQRPLHQHEAWIDFDQSVIDAGLETLAHAREAFDRGLLPSRPKEWRWTKPPCQWCNFKRECKADIKADIENAAESHAVLRAKEISPAYDYAAARQAVLSRWQNGGDPRE